MIQLDDEATNGQMADYTAADGWCLLSSELFQEPAKVNIDSLI